MDASKIDPPAARDTSTLEEDISAVLNRHSAENASNTPDFILAQYLLGCLAAFGATVKARDAWYGPPRLQIHDRAVSLQPPHQTTYKPGGVK